MYTDHNNLIFIFDPLAVLPDIGLAAVHKVLRWAVRLSMYKYDCFCIRGDENVWADLMTRWSILLITRRLVNISPLPTTFEDFEWLSSDAIHSSQLNNSSQRPNPSFLTTIHGKKVFLIQSGFLTSMSFYRCALPLSRIAAVLATVEKQLPYLCSRNTSPGLHFKRISPSLWSPAFIVSLR